MEKPTKRSRAMTLISHALLILIIFILPEIVMAIAMPHRRGIGLNYGLYIKTIVFIAVFYINYSVLIERLLGNQHPRHRILRFIVFNIIILFIGLGICFEVSWITFRPRNPNIDNWSRAIKIFTFITRDLVMMILSIALAVALRLSSKWKDIEQQKKEIMATQRASELDSLKSQLNPHFLFNTLNTIYALIAVDSDKAQKAVHQLSALLRYMLYDDQGSVPLSQECKFIENYVALMRLRLSSKTISVHIDPGLYADTLIPALLFIPLVENAFKYGISSPDDTPIEIDITAADGLLTCKVSNSFIRKETEEGPKRDSGIGLTNLRRRLSLIYGHRASLSTKIAGNMYSACLNVPL